MSLDYSLSVDEMAPVWTPQPGDRVRVRLSAECDVKGEPSSIQQQRGFRGHFPDEDGIQGTVKRIEPTTDHLARQGHAYVVHFSRRLISGVLVCCINYSANELEPLHDEVQP